MIDVDDDEEGEEDFTDNDVFKSQHAAGPFMNLKSRNILTLRPKHCGLNGNGKILPYIFSHKCVRLVSSRVVASGMLETKVMYVNMFR